jgi:hypothetical protein
MSSNVAFSLSPVASRLLESCRHARLAAREGRTILEAVAEPQWERTRPHLNDWRNSVPPTIADQWDDLPLEARLAVFFITGLSEQAHC